MGGTEEGPARMGIIFNKDPRSPPLPFLPSLALSFARTKIEPARTYVRSMSHLFPFYFCFFFFFRKIKMNSAPRCTEFDSRRNSETSPNFFPSLPNDKRSFVSSKGGSCIIIIYAIITFMTHFILVNCPPRSRPSVITRRLGYHRRSPFSSLPIPRRRRLFHRSILLRSTDR